MSRILHNKARCKLCDDVIESTYRWDFVTCSCGALSVDGGHDYLRRCGNLDAIEELSEHVEDSHLLLLLLGLFDSEIAPSETVLLGTLAFTPFSMEAQLTL